MKILIIGSKGQLGRDLLAQAQARGWTAVGADLPECDITDPQSLAGVFSTASQIDIVINAAAFTAVDAAESQPDFAFAVNRDSVGRLAATCRQAAVPLLHLSTDYVFDGRKRSPYLPRDPVNPQGVYARSKAQGESILRKQLDRHVIVRTSWLFGLQGANFVKTMLRLGRERDLIRVVDDQVGCPTYAGDLAAALLDVAAYVVRHADAWGTYHFCNQGAVTWYAFTGRILALAQTHEPMRVKRIEPISTTEYPLPAPRPAYSVLDCRSLEARFGIIRRHWEDGLKEMLTLLYRP